MSAEEWHPIPGFPGYDASNLGRVRSHHRSQLRVLSQCPNDRGYMIVHLIDADRRNRTLTVHRAVASAFLGPLPGKTQTRHLDGNKLNNTAANLAYGTNAENTRDQVIHGVHYHARKTHCPQNHEYTEANTRRARDGSRQCRTCEKRRLEGRRKVAAA